MLGDRRVCLMDQRLSFGDIAIGPPGCRAFQLRPGTGQPPFSGPGTGLGPPQPWLRLIEPAGLDTEPAVRQRTMDKQVVGFDIAPARVLIEQAENLGPYRNRVRVHVVIA